MPIEEFRIQDSESVVAGLVLEQRWDAVLRKRIAFCPAIPPQPELLNSEF
jgi:hypothetical protein